MNKQKKMTLHEVSALHVLGRHEKVTLRGESSVVHAAADVINASRELYVMLCSENATMKEISTLLEQKQLAAKVFYDTTGIKWRL